MPRGQVFFVQDTMKSCKLLVQLWPNNLIAKKDSFFHSLDLVFVEVVWVSEHTLGSREQVDRSFAVGQHVTLEPETLQHFYLVLGGGVRNSHQSVLADSLDDIFEF